MSWSIKPISPSTSLATLCALILQSILCQKKKHHKENEEWLTGLGCKIIGYLIAYTFGEKTIETLEPPIFFFDPKILNWLYTLKLVTVAMIKTVDSDGHNGSNRELIVTAMVVMPETLMVTVMVTVQQCSKLAAIQPSEMTKMFAGQPICW